MRKRNLAALFLLVAALAFVAAGCGGDDDDEAVDTGPAAEEPAGEAADCTGSVAVMAPITGDAASIGQEQLNFVQFAVQKFNEDNGTNYTLEEVDTQLDPAQASTGAQRIVGNNDILGVVGPAGSQEVEAVGPIFERAPIAYVSGSATRVSLTESGDFPSFFRTVPNDDAQGPTAAEFIVEELDPQTAWVIDDQSSYSTGLADIAASNLEEAGVEVQRESISQDDTDFSALVSRVANADVVFLPWQLGSQAQTFGTQLAEQGSDAVIVGSDGLFTEDFFVEGSYVLSFAPDIRGIESSQPLVEEYEADFGQFTSTFGPPSYAAANILLTAIQDACNEQGGQPSREQVIETLRGTTVDESILGGSLTFDDNGDVEDAQFYIFQVTGRGQYELQP